MPKPLRGGAARARRRGAYASAHGEQQGVPKHLQPAHYLVSGSWVGSHRGLGILICDSWGRRPPRCRRRCVLRSHTLLQGCMCCFADTHLPMPEADKPRGTTVPELNDKTLPLRHLGSHKADDEGDVTRPLPLAMLTYQHTRGATLLHTARQGSSNAGDIWGLLSSRGTSTTSMAEINGSISGSDRRPAPLIPPRLSSVPSTTLFSGCSRGQRRQAVILPRRPAPVAVPVFPYSPTFCLLVPGVVGAAVMATQAVEGQFDDASPPLPPPGPPARPGGRPSRGRP